LTSNDQTSISATTVSPIRVGVAGAGVFGRNHANKLKADPGATLVGVFDRTAERAEILAGELQTQAFATLEDLLSQVDALVVATPAIAHGGVARAAIDAGKHCLVEKPLAATSQDADTLVALAAARGVVLQAGHQERYIFAAMGLLEVAERPSALLAVRAGLPSLRGADVSVTLDLMVHDIDLARMLFRADPVAIEAKRLSGQPDNPDAVEAHLTFEGGGTAVLIASRAAEERDRRMQIDYANGQVAIDFIAKSFVDGPGFGLHPDFANRIPDPMGAATADFLAAIRGERAVAISAKDGAAAVHIAQAIDTATRS
jgi:predicted dehydrogenase